MINGSTRCTREIVLIIVWVLVFRLYVTLCRCSLITGGPKTIKSLGGKKTLVGKKVSCDQLFVVSRPMGTFPKVLAAMSGVVRWNIITHWLTASFFGTCLSDWFPTCQSNKPSYQMEATPFKSLFNIFFCIIDHCDSERNNCPILIWHSGAVWDVWIS